MKTLSVSIPTTFGEVKTVVNNKASNVRQTIADKVSLLSKPSLQSSLIQAAIEYVRYA